MAESAVKWVPTTEELIQMIAKVRSATFAEAAAHFRLTFAKQKAFAEEGGIAQETLDSLTRQHEEAQTAAITIEVATIRALLARLADERGV